MWVSGIMQGLMWRAYDHLGFLEYVRRNGRGHASLLRHPRLGGALFLIGALIMATTSTRPRGASCATNARWSNPPPLRRRLEQADTGDNR
jgi:cbb3-type cytochrome oxidase subunit 1